MRLLAAFVTGRRTKWLVPVIWIALAVVFAPLGSKLADETSDETESFLPGNAESTKVTKLLNERFEGGQIGQRADRVPAARGADGAGQAQDR